MYSISHCLCAHLSPAFRAISFCELYIKMPQILYIYSPNIYCQHLCVTQASGPTPSFCLSTHRHTYLLSFQPLSLGLGCGYHFTPLALIILSYSLPCINPGILILHHVSRPHFPALVHTYGCRPPSGRLRLQSSPKIIYRPLSGSQGGQEGKN